MTYKTKTTWLGREYGSQVLSGDKVIVEWRCKTRDLIGATFRDLLRTLDKMGGDSFTSAARNRINRKGNASVSVKHIWGR